MKKIKVLIVEDDPMVIEIHKKYIQSLHDFDVVGTVQKGNDALDFLENHKVSLIILDIFMPEVDGIETLKNIRERQKDVDVILITAARESTIIKKVLRYGAFDYIVKPFTFERIKSSLESYKKYYLQMVQISEEYSQKDIDNIFAPKLRLKHRKHLPKGLQEGTLQKIIKHLNNNNNKCLLSADEVAQKIGVSRVTARRYLEYLVSSGNAVMELSYKVVGRPINKYRLLK